MRKRHGSPILGLLIALVLIAGLGATAFRAFQSQGGGPAGPAPIDRARDAACAANRAVIEQTVQIYRINHDLPAEELDLEKVFAPGRPPKPPAGSSCTYSLDPQGRVSCPLHK
jgi:hypothetical protein